MLWNLVIFSLFFVAIRASGEFSVLSSPSSLQFEGNDALQSEYIGDVFNIAVGNAIIGDAQWAGMSVSDPFNLASHVIAVLVDGSKNIDIDTKAKKFDLEGSSADDSINALTIELEASNEPVCNINFNDFEEGVTNLHACFGDISPAAARSTSQLNAALHSADKQFLETLSYVDSAAENLANMQKNSKFLFFRLSLESIAKAHGEKSEPMQEAIILVSDAIAKLNDAIAKLNDAAEESNNKVLFVAIANKNVGGRYKRETVAGSTGNDYNLAEYYNQDYPVIFNIILWFMVAFGFALLAICYAIGTMDPGRDSIIYRMTSTRMKKDN